MSPSVDPYGPTASQRAVILLKSKTLWGTIFATGAWLFAQPHIDLHTLVQAAGTVVGAAGVRDAITQHGITPG